MIRVTLKRGLLCLAAVALWAAFYESADAARWLDGNRAPTQASRSYAPGPTGIGNGYNRGNSSGGWNRSNSWYNVPQYGNYAPPPYATSRAALIQIGPLPAFGGVRSLPGWGGAR